MADDLAELLENPFHGAALLAFVQQAQLQQDWPCPAATRRRAYQLFEAELASSSRNDSAAAEPDSVANNRRK